MRRRVRRGRREATCGGADDMRALRVSPPKPLQRDCTIADADADADAGAGGTTLNELPACILAGAPEPPTRAGARYHRHRACASSHHSPRPIGAFHPCAPLPKPPPSPPPRPPLLPPSRAPRGRRSREARALWRGPRRRVPGPWPAQRPRTFCSAFAAVCLDFDRGLILGLFPVAGCVCAPQRTFWRRLAWRGRRLPPAPRAPQAPRGCTAAPGRRPGRRARGGGLGARETVWGCW